MKLLSCLLPIALLCLAPLPARAELRSHERASDERPNLVLVLADDLGYGDLGCYGQTRVRTPHLDRLAAEGLRLTDFYAGSTVCAPSRCVLMTGLHTGHCRVRGNARVPLEDEDLTVAEVLKGAGYATGLFGKWGLGEAGSSGAPTRQGFDEFYGYLNQRHAHNYWPTHLWRGEERVELRNVMEKESKEGAGIATERKDYSHDLITDEALSFVDRHREQPFFLYLAYTIPHANNEAGKDGMEVPDLADYGTEDWPESRKRFASMVSRLDRDVGRLRTKLEELGLAENTLILFSSDNGPHREGGHDPEFFASRGPLKGIKRSLHDGGIRVPTIAWWPKGIPGGRVSNESSGFQEVLPTFAEIAGAKVPEGLDGDSIAGLLRGDPDFARKAPLLYWAFFERGGGRAVRFGQWKAVQQPYHSPIRIYDLLQDVGEQNDLAAKHPELVESAEKRMDSAFTPSPHWRFPKEKAKKR